jgi:hypothetical protein
VIAPVRLKSTRFIGEARDRPRHHAATRAFSGAIGYMETYASSAQISPPLFEPVGSDELGVSGLVVGATTRPPASQEIHRLTGGSALARTGAINRPRVRRGGHRPKHAVEWAPDPASARAVG